MKAHAAGGDGGARVADRRMLGRRGAKDSS